MSMSAFQKVTLVSCVALCVALLLPKMLLSRGTRDASQSEGSAGQFPPMLHRKPSPDGGPGLFSRPHAPEATARAKGSTAARGKSNLAGQIIPVYGFGILLYILYIIFKITSKGKSSSSHENRFSDSMRSENMKRKITDFELTQLQERLRETEDVMERIVSRAQTQHGSPESAGPVSVDQEEALLLQLREITRVMQEGHLIEGIPTERDTMEPCGDQDLEDSTEVRCDVSFCTIHHQKGTSCQEPSGAAGDIGRAQTEGSAWNREAFCCGKNNPEDQNLHDFREDEVHGEEHITGACVEEEVLAGQRMKTLEDLASETEQTKYGSFNRTSESETKDSSTLIRRKTKKEAVRVI